MGVGVEEVADGAVEHVGVSARGGAARPPQRGWGLRRHFTGLENKWGSMSSSRDGSPRSGLQPRGHTGCGEDTAAEAGDGPNEQAWIFVVISGQFFKILLSMLACIFALNRWNVGRENMHRRTN